MNIAAGLRRAFIANPRTVSLSESEQTTLVSQGVEQSTVQKYLAWRRGLMLFVVVATVLSAGLATWRDFAESEHRVDLYEAIEKYLPLDPQAAVPAVIHAAEESAEAASGTEEDEMEDEASAEEEEEEEPETAFGQFTDIVQLVALYALPIAALSAVMLWTRFRLSFQIIVAAFAFSFLVPMLIALCPWSWWGYVEPAATPETKPGEYARQTIEGLLEAASYLVTLLPTVLSLIPGVQRACIRVKLLLPQAMLPGWFLVVASPFYALFLLVVFVAINQVDTHPLFFIGMLLFLSAPLVFSVRADIVTKPLATPEDERRLLAVKRVVGGMTVGAAVLLVIYLATREMLGIRLLGMDARHSLLLPLDLVEFGLETMSRSMFMTVLGADLFMRMNLTDWKNSRDFATTADAAQYDRVMGELERIA